MLVQTYDTIRTMQVLQLAVARGFTRWTGGRVRYDRAERLVAKFEELYTVNPTRAQDMRLRRAGHARSRLVLLPESNALEFAWWLLVSAGTGPVAQRETLLDATDRRQRIALRGWELLRIPKRQAKETVAWTWRLPEQDFREQWAHACAVATHESPHQAQALIAAMAAAARVAGAGRAAGHCGRAYAAGRRCLTAFPIAVRRCRMLPGRLLQSWQRRPLTERNGGQPLQLASIACDVFFFQGPAGGLACVVDAPSGEPFQLRREILFVRLLYWGWLRHPSPQHRQRRVRVSLQSRSLQ